jgi:mono/diheme cytochrome c family protein
VIRAAFSDIFPAAMIYAAAIVWVLLGLGIFIVAVRRGPRGTGEVLDPSSGASRWAINIVMLLVVAFGLAVPALVLAFNGADKASDAPGGVHLNAEQQKGRHLFGDTCVFCHTLSAADSVGRTGPNLDVLIPTVSSNFETRKAFVESAIESGFAGHYGQMPAELFQGPEAKEVASFVAAVAGH